LPSRVTDYDGCLRPHWEEWSYSKNVKPYSAELPESDIAAYLPDTRGLQPFAL
jgi:hypothetical protein